MAATKKDSHSFHFSNFLISLILIFNQPTWSTGHHHMHRGFLTFIFETSDDVGCRHGSAVICKTVVELHHVLRWLFSNASRRQQRGTQARQVESPQELFLQALQQALHAHVAVLLQQWWIHHPSVPVSQPRSGAMPLMGVWDWAGLSTERLLEQQDGKHHEQSLGATDGSQLRDPNARHEEQSAAFYFIVSGVINGWAHATVRTNDCDPWTP